MKFGIKLFVILNIVTCMYGASIVIDRAGTYFIRGNILGNPTGPDDVGIEVAVDNVEIDFGGYAVMQMPGNTQSGFKGVKVNSDLMQVSIKNGVVQDVTGEGILIQDGCKNIHIEEMLIKSCDNGGIYFDSTVSGTGISNCLIEDCMVLTCTGADGGAARGLYMNNVDGVVVRDCFFNDNDAQMTGTGFGVECISCNLCKFANCTAASNGGFERGGGFSFASCSDCFLDFCGVGQSIARSSASTSFAAGFFFDQCNNIVLTGCESMSNQHTQGKAVGFLCTEGSGLLFNECLAEGQMGDTEACGFEFQDQDCSSITRCASKLNKTVTSGAAYGILLAGSLNDNCSIVECSVEHNKGAGSSFGMADGNNPCTNLWMRNQAFNNGTNYDITYSVGISLPVIQASLSNSLIGLPTLVAGDLDNLDIEP